jgi:hypothetical protein
MAWHKPPIGRLAFPGFNTYAHTFVLTTFNDHGILKWLMENADEQQEQEADTRDCHFQI